MAKAKDNADAVPIDAAPAASDDRVAALEARLADVTAKLDRVTTLLMREEGEMTPERKARKEWAMSSPQAKTELVLAERYPPQPGDGRFSVVLLNNEQEKKPTECFLLTLPARSADEAQIRYQRIMGINRTEGYFDVKQVAAPAAA